MVIMPSQVVIWLKESQWGGTILGRIGGETIEQVEQTITYIAENEALEGEIIFPQSVRPMGRTYVGNLGQEPPG